MSNPELSVIVCPTSSTLRSIRTCLEWLHESLDGVNAECFVPYDERLDKARELASEYGWVRFLDGREAVAKRGLALYSHERYNVLRALALRSARGRIVAILEDHGLPAPDWAHAVLDAHRGPKTVIGGAVENRVDRLLNLAVYYCDFGRFQNPVARGPMRWVTSVNVSYKRHCIEQVRHLWEEEYCEPVVHDALRAAGHDLVLDGRIVVFENRELRVVPSLVERFVWGRSFAAVRARRVSVAMRCVFASLSFALPLLRGSRVAGRAIHKRRGIDRMIAALPLILLLELFWAAGEFTGYITARPSGMEAACDQKQPCAQSQS